jgi:hypothetical protein
VSRQRIATPESVLIDDATWNQRKGEWLPSSADGDFIASPDEAGDLSRRLRQLDFAAEGRHRQQARRFRVRENRDLNSGSSNMDPDCDLEALNRDQLVAEVKRLRAGIRTHRDSTGHDLCWHHPDLWGLLPERVAPEVAVPPWPKFLRGCLRYREALDRELPGAPRADFEYE